MKRLKNLWTRFLDWLFGNNQSDGDLERFETDLYEDLREEIIDSIVEDKRKKEKFEAINQKIRLGLRLSAREQKESGFLQFGEGELF